METFEQLDTTPDSQSFASTLLLCSQEKVAKSYTITEIRDEIGWVAKWFEKDGQFYDKDTNVVSLSGAVLLEANAQSTQHSLGELNPKTKANWTDEESTAIDSIHAHNLLHNSATDRSEIAQHSLPEGVTDINQCLVHQLKNIVISHGGTCTEDGKNMNKKQLKRCAMAHLRLEKENPLHMQVFNRSKDNYNGTFINIDTSERRSIPRLLTS